MGGWTYLLPPPPPPPPPLLEVLPLVLMGLSLCGWVGGWAGWPSFSRPREGGWVGGSFLPPPPPPPPPPAMPACMGGGGGGGPCIYIIPTYSDLLTHLVESRDESPPPSLSSPHTHTHTHLHTPRSCVCCSLISWLLWRVVRPCSLPASVACLCGWVGGWVGGSAK